MRQFRRPQRKTFALKVNPALLSELLDYDPATGGLVWKRREPRHFSGDRSQAHSCAQWNAWLAGKEAFTAKANGYLVGSIMGRREYAHRVIYAIMTGEWPPYEIDHIDGDRANNRWNNLRSVTRGEQRLNSKLRKDSRSGVLGVGWYAKKQKWRARIRLRGKQKHLGFFDTVEAAAAARHAAEREYGFHPNHGRSE